jgi:hypothetical protein
VRKRLVALEAKVAELTALLAQSVTPVSEVQLASKSLFLFRSI